MRLTRLLDVYNAARADHATPLELLSVVPVDALRRQAEERSDKWFGGFVKDAEGVYWHVKRRKSGPRVFGDWTQNVRKREALAYLLLRRVSNQAEVIG